MDSFPTGSAAFSNQPVSKVTNESENSANVTTPTLNQLLVNSGQKYHSGFGSSEAMQEEDNQHAMSSRFPQRPPVPNQGQPYQYGPKPTMMPGHYGQHGQQEVPYAKYGAYSGMPQEMGNPGFPPHGGQPPMPGNRMGVPPDFGAVKRDSGGPNFEGMQQNYPPFEDHSFDRFKKDTLSHPPTPVTPGASSTHDEYDVASSPSCPGTPKVDNRDVSHVMGSMSVVPGLPNTTSTPSKLSNEGQVFSRMCELGNEPDRRPFLERLFRFNEQRGQPITAMPMISKSHIDLFRLYVLVKVTKTKKWRDVCTAINCGTSGSAGFTLRRNYIKYLFHYECHYDRGGIDPAPIIAQVESLSKKDSSKRDRANTAVCHANTPTSQDGGRSSQADQQMVQQRDMMFSNQQRPPMFGMDNQGGMNYPRGPMMQRFPHQPMNNMRCPPPMHPQPPPPVNRMMEGMPPDQAQPQPLPQQQQHMMAPVGPSTPNRPQSASSIPDAVAQQPSSAQPTVPQQAPMKPSLAGGNTDMGQEHGVPSGGQQPPMHIPGASMRGPAPPGHMTSQMSTMPAAVQQGSMPHPPAMGMQPGLHGSQGGLPMQGQQHMPQDQNNQGHQQPGQGPHAHANQMTGQEHLGQQGQMPGQGQPVQVSQGQLSGSSQGNPTQMQGHGQTISGHGVQGQTGPNSKMPGPVQPHPGLPSQGPLQQMGQMQPSTGMHGLSPAGHGQQPASQQPQQGQGPLMSQGGVAAPQGQQMSGAVMSGLPQGHPAQSHMTQGQQAHGSPSQTPPTSQMHGMAQGHGHPHGQMQGPPGQSGPGGNMHSQGQMPGQGGQHGHVQMPGAMGENTMMHGQNAPGGHMQQQHQGYMQGQGGMSAPHMATRMHMATNSHMGMQGQIPAGSMQGNMPGHQAPMFNQASMAAGHMQGSMHGSNGHGHFPRPTGMPGQMFGAQNEQGNPMTSRPFEGQPQPVAATPVAADGANDKSKLDGVPGHVTQFPSCGTPPRAPSRDTISGEGFQASMSSLSPSYSGQNTAPSYGNLISASAESDSKDSNVSSMSETDAASKQGQSEQGQSEGGGFQKLLKPIDGTEKKNPDSNEPKPNEGFNGQKVTSPFGRQTDESSMSSVTSAMNEGAENENHFPAANSTAAEERDSEFGAGASGDSNDKEFMDPKSDAKTIKKQPQSTGDNAAMLPSGIMPEGEMDIKPKVEVSDSMMSGRQMENGFNSTRLPPTSRFIKRPNPFGNNIPPPNSKPMYNPDGSFGPMNPMQHRQVQMARGKVGPMEQTTPVKSVKQEGGFSQRREIYFPHDSVEAAQPNLMKRKRLACRDIGSTSAWKLMLALKSGLLAQSTWALDVLNIQLHDDHSVHWFGLQTMPGLLDILTDYWNCVTSAMFPDKFEVTKPEVRDVKVAVAKEEEESLDSFKPQLNTKLEKVFDGSDYTKHSRTGNPVRYVEDLDESCFALDDKEWDNATASSTCISLSMVYAESRTSADGKSDHAREEIAKRFACLSNIVRSLSFVPGNEKFLSQHVGILTIFGKLLLLHHNHRENEPEQTFDVTTGVFDQKAFSFESQSSKHLYSFAEPMDGEGTDVESPCGCDKEWWSVALDTVRENILVSLANIAAYIDGMKLSDAVLIPILDGLLHWATCSFPTAQDPLPNCIALSAQRLAIEALTKVCILQNNVNLLLAIPPFSRVVQLCGVLVKLLGNKTEQVMREFAVTLLSQLVLGDLAVAKALALQSPAISLLMDFIENAEESASQLVQQHGMMALRENPELIGTTQDLLKRAAFTLYTLSEVPENQTHFIHREDRLLKLCMSQILEPGVASKLADVLFQCQKQHTVLT